MTTEIFWLTLTIVLTTLMVLPYAIYRTRKLGGILQVFKNPLPGDSPIEAAWAHRAYRAHMNAFEGLILYAPLVLALHVTSQNNAVTAITTAVYFWSRLLYAPLYYFDVAYLKTAIWSVGLFATLTLAYQLLF